MKKDNSNNTDFGQTRFRSTRPPPPPQPAMQRLQLNTIEYNSPPASTPILSTGPSIETILESPPLRGPSDNATIQTSPLRASHKLVSPELRPDFRPESSLISSTTTATQFFGKDNLIPHESVVSTTALRTSPDMTPIRTTAANSEHKTRVLLRNEDTSTAATAAAASSSGGPGVSPPSSSLGRQTLGLMSTVPTPDLPKSLRLIFEDDLLLPRYAEPIPIEPASDSKTLEQSRAKILELATIYLQRQQQQQQQQQQQPSPPSSGSATPKASPFLSPSLQPDTINLSPNITPAQKPVSPNGALSKPIGIFSPNGGPCGNEDDLKQVASSPFTQMPLETPSVGRPRRMSTARFQPPFIQPFRRGSNAGPSFEATLPTTPSSSLGTLSTTEFDDYSESATTTATTTTIAAAATTTTAVKDRKVFSLDESLPLQQSPSQNQPQNVLPQPLHAPIPSFPQQTPPLPPPLSPPRVTFSPQQQQQQQQQQQLSSLSSSAITASVPIPLQIDTPVGKRIGGGMRPMSSLQKTRSAGSQGQLPSLSASKSSDIRRNISLSTGTPIRKALVSGATDSPYHANSHVRRSDDFLKKPLITPRKTIIAKFSEPSYRSIPQQVPDPDSGNTSLSPMESPTRENNFGRGSSTNSSSNNGNNGPMMTSPLGDPFMPGRRKSIGNTGGRRRSNAVPPLNFKGKCECECAGSGSGKGGDRPSFGSNSGNASMSTHSSGNSCNCKEKKAPVMDDYYWNNQFMEAIAAISSLTHNSHFEERVSAYDRLSRLAEDFNQTVRTYGRIIISEVHLPVEQKSIKPASELGGIAGGEKYVVHGILFKFAVDSKKMYGGDEHAAKVAGHDLKSLVHLYNCWEPGVHFPMMTLVDYRGFRIVGMPMLPVSKTTIVHGSNDAGKTVHTSPEFNRILKSIGEKLNLKPHRVGKEGKVFYTPIDLEGHLGEDGKLYMLDFSRLFPPQTPSCAHKMSHLYQLLRPEFVRMYKKPLCSDAFSTFIIPDQSDEERSKEAEEHDNEVDEATHYLTEELLQVFAQRLVQLPRDQRDTFPLIVLLHESGINVRFLGLLYRYVEDLHDDYWATKLLVEMATRVIKVELQALLRDNKAPGESRYKKIVVRYMNTVFGNFSETKNYWRNKITPRMKKKFPGFVYETPSPSTSSSPSLSPSFPSFSTTPAAVAAGPSAPPISHIAGFSSIVCSPPQIMFPPQRSPPPLSAITPPTTTTAGGTTPLSSTGQLPSSSRHSGEITFTRLDSACGNSNSSNNNSGGSCKCLYDTIAKATHSVGLLDGRCLLFRSVAQTLGLYFAPAIWKEAIVSPAVFDQPYPFTETDLVELRERVKEMNVASHSRGYYLKTKAVAVKSPEERNRLLSLAVQQFSRALEGNPDNKVTLRNLGDCYILLGDADKAQDVYERSITIDPDDPNSLYKYGIALDKIGHLDEAERYYIRSLEAYPLHSNCFCAYADFLCYQRKNFDEAETFYKKAVEVDPTNYAASNNYAVFLVTVRRKMDEAERCFVRAVEGNPRCEVYLSNYASFLMHIKLEIEKAQEYASKATKLSQRIKTNLPW